MDYVSRVPQPPLDELIDDLYYLAGAPPYERLKLPPMPSAVLILNLGDPFRIGDANTTFADGCFITTGTSHFEFACPARTRSVGVHFKPWGWAPFVGIAGDEARDLQLTMEQVWGRYAHELRDRLDAARSVGAMLGLLEQELRRRMHDVPALDLVRYVSERLAGTTGAVPIADICTDTGVSSTHLARQFKRSAALASDNQRKPKTRSLPWGKSSWAPPPSRWTGSSRRRRTTSGRCSTG